MSHMFKRICLCLFLLSALGSLALAVEDELTLKYTTKAGALTLAPGTYHVKVKGSLVFFVEDKSQKSVSTVATIEKTDKKSQFSTVEGPVADGNQQAHAILLQGADYRIVFSH